MSIIEDSWVNDYFESIKKVVAKRIFEDIEKIPRIECNQTAYIHPNSIKKLKKKWTS